MATAAPPSANLERDNWKGVKPLRAGEGLSFLLRRLHSLSGIIPVGAFLVEHFVSNAYATNGPHAYATQIKFLNSLPFVPFLEWGGIYIPILYHALYGIYVWYRGESNVTTYPWQGNWMYAAQRWTGIIAFAYMIQHVYHLRFTGPQLLEYPGAGFGKVQQELANPWMLAFYVVAIIAASWHFAYGIWLFCAKWGITQGEGARRKSGVVCFAIGLLFVIVGLVTVKAFVAPRDPAWRHMGTDPAAAKQVEAQQVQ
ncbi:MAG: succinate dehydrogenase cytochrome b558 subunit [Terriglobales bacterium]